jgi:hypothetical protein
MGLKLEGRGFTSYDAERCGLRTSWWEQPQQFVHQSKPLGVDFASEEIDPGRVAGRVCACCEVGFDVSFRGSVP